MTRLNFPEPVVFFDLESTGTWIKLDRIVQIGLVKLYPDGTQTEWSTLINPEMPIPPEATAIHRIDDYAVRNAPTFKQQAAVLQRGLDGCYVAGFNSDRFDIQLLRTEFDRVGCPHPRFRGSFDVYELFRRNEPRTLSAAARFYLQEEHAGAHDALADVRITIRVLEAQLERYGIAGTPEALCATPDESAHFVDSTGRFIWRFREPYYNFGGKHLGTSLRQIASEDPSYLRWMLRNDFPEDTRRLVEDALRGNFPTREPAPATPSAEQ